MKTIIPCRCFRFRSLVPGLVALTCSLLALLADEPLPLDAPSDINATEGFERGAVTVEWAPVPGALTYEVWRATTPEIEAMELLIGGLEKPGPFKDRTADFDQHYFYRVRAVNEDAVSPFSEAAAGRQSTRRWILGLDAALITAPALGQDGLLRFVLAASGKPATNSMVAVDAAGIIRWRVDSGPVVSGPVLGDDDTAYCVTLDSLIAVDATGVRKWTQPLPERTINEWRRIQPSALALTGDGNLVVGIDPERVYWYTPDGELFRTGSTAGMSAQAVVITEDGGVCLSGSPYALSMFERNGLSRWRLSEMNAGNLAAGLSGAIIGAGNGQVFQKAASGELNWRWRYGPDTARVNTPIVGHDGTVYLVRPGFELMALSGGSLLWSSPALGIDGSPALLDNGTLLVYRGSFVFAYDPEGTALWQASSGGTRDLYDPQSPVAGPDGTIYVVGGANLVCLTGESPLAAEGWPSWRRDARQTGCMAGPSPAPAPLVDASASEGTSVNQIRVSWAPNPDLAWVEVWRSLSSDLATAVLVGVVEPGTFEYYDEGVHPGEMRHYWLRAKNDVGMTSLTESLRGYGGIEARVAWIHESTSRLSQPALGRGDQVLVTSADGVLLSVDDQGQTAWTYAELAAPLQDPVVALDGTILVRNDSNLIALRPEGTVRWHRPLDAGEIAPMVTGWDGTLYLVEGGQLTAIDSEGQDRWQITLANSSPVHLAVGTDDRLRIGSPSGTYRLAHDGSVAQKFSSGSGPFALDTDDTLFLAVQSYVLSAVARDGVTRFNFEWIVGRRLAHDEPVLGADRRVFISRAIHAFGEWTYAINAQGELLWRYPALASGMVADASGGVVFARTNHLTALRSDGSLRWDYQIADAQPTAPFLTEDGRLCFSAGNRLIMLQTELRPAPSGWPMTRADAQRSGRAVASCRILTCGRSLGGELEIQFAGQADVTYAVEQSSDLVEWEEVTQCIALPGVTCVLLAGEIDQHRFFRIRRLDPMP
jgi:hypothetical protein